MTIVLMLCALVYVCVEYICISPEKKKVELCINGWNGMRHPYIECYIIDTFLLPKIIAKNGRQSGIACVSIIQYSFMRTPILIK